MTLNNEHAFRAGGLDPGSPMCWGSAVPPEAQSYGAAVSDSKRGAESPNQKDAPPSSQDLGAELCEGAGLGHTPVLSISQGLP